MVQGKSLWTDRIMLNTYAGAPCGDGVYEYQRERWGQGEFVVRLLLDPEGGLRSQYLADTVQPDALKPPIERWENLYNNNHIDVLEKYIYSTLNTNRASASSGDNDRSTDDAVSASR